MSNIDARNLASLIILKHLKEALKEAEKGIVDCDYFLSKNRKDDFTDETRNYYTNERNKYMEACLGVQEVIREALK